MRITEKCMVCQDISPQYAEGMFIRGNFLCDCCEEMIASLEVKDVYYPYIKNCLKKIWFDETEKRYLS
ncbi:MAG: sigma factor G inhibitor Gin [Bacillota bacterium]|jgi:hypothetical protein